MLPMEDYDFLHTKHINFSLLNSLLNKEHKFSIPPPSCADFPIFKNYKTHNITFKQDILNYDKNIKSQDTEPLEAGFVSSHGHGATVYSHQSKVTKHEPTCKQPGNCS